VADPTIKRRCFISLGDHEPLDIAQQFGLFQRGLQRFADTWSVAGNISRYVTEWDGAVAVWRVECGASNWKVQTEFRLWNWSDLLSNDFQPWSLRRVVDAVRAIYHFIRSGACWHYFRASRRFGLYFLYPILSVFGFALIAFFLTRTLGAFEVPYAGGTGFLVGIALFTSFVKWIDPYDFSRVLKLWVFLHALVHLERSSLAERLGIFSQDLVEVLKRNDFDEIIVAGHGFGAALLPVVVDRAFWDYPEFGKSGGKISILSTGSMLLAVGLHPEGSWVVGPVSRVSRDRMAFWVEFQAREDLIGFSGCNPIELLTEGAGTLSLQDIQLSKMTSIDLSRKISDRIYRLHRQSVLANSKRYFYDFFMICCGPLSLKDRVRNAALVVEAFDQQGRIVPAVLNRFSGRHNAS
jgi:hypothetical protein